MTELLWGLFHKNTIKKTSASYCRFYMLLFLDHRKIDTMLVLGPEEFPALSPTNDHIVFERRFLKDHYML